MRHCILMMTILVSLTGHSQINSTKQNDQAYSYSRFEGLILPALVYNHLNIGMSFSNNVKHEHVFSFGGFLTIYNPLIFNLHVDYNYNRFLKNRQTYIPFWHRTGNTARNVGYEEGHFPHTLNFSLGSGIGKLNKLNERLLLRTELKTGASLILAGDAEVFSYGKYNISDADYPVFPAIYIHVAIVFK